jgi:hypothetical protein
MHRLSFLMSAATLMVASETARIPLPADLSGTHGQTEYIIRVPANWNGTLLTWLPGSGVTEIEIAPPVSPTFAADLLARGYAIGSVRGPRGPEGTLDLLAIFRGTVGSPRQTIMWGLSKGAIETGKLIEKYPGIFDGGIALAFMGAGGSKQTSDFHLRYALAYDAVFGWPTDWWGPIEDIRDDLLGKEATDIMPVFAWGGTFAQWEFIRLVMKESETAWWSWEPGLAGWAFEGWAATAGRSEMEAIVGGPFASNVGTVYSLTSTETAYLATLGIDAEPLLARMNARANIVPYRPAANRAAQEFDFTGNLRRPLLVLHGKYDPIQPPSGVEAYRALVTTTGHDANFAAVYVNTWHGPYSPEQCLRALAAMETWLGNGLRPDISFFPTSEGFDPVFNPGPWAY